MHNKREENIAEYVNMTDYIRYRQSEEKIEIEVEPMKIEYLFNHAIPQSERESECESARTKRFDRQSLERVVVHIFHHLVRIATIYRATNLNSDRALAIRIFIYKYEYILFHRRSRIVSYS